ncbi:MAG TPA: DUF2062 domain-containing protein [Blastocatellia bacterium]|nr:DUF2062 domain-containing protein [Blastocatellia bacterium]HMV83491.1 DUF2062 domain-containing protein [Blastocatellia bacterium]HMX28833.1 DUF2062 domain-containing protein [Blastocatellia bacterium]HMY72733.1 DUF2062 domain-containing protein [Blastocatellia bacterium]HNG30875.1 DUF2062 domain-containing protein [Blastocatellia bacterium]
MLRRAFRNLLNLDDPPERTALAFAIGALIGFSPLLGLHTIIAAIVAVVWRLNKVALFTGVYISNPWTVAPVVAVSWAIGRWFVETPPIELPQFTMTAIASAEFWRQIASQWPQLLPFAIGASIVSVVCALVSYPLMLYVLRAYRRKYPNNSAATSATLNRESFTERN